MKNISRVGLLLFILALLFVGGCSNPEPSPTPSVSPPATQPPWSGLRVYRESDTSIQAAVGEEFIISLQTEIGLGRNWYESYDNTRVRLVDREYTQDHQGGPFTGMTWSLFQALITRMAEFHGHSPWVNEEAVV
jgi:hypothetical protein